MNDALFAMMFIRLYFLFRTIINYSIYQDAYCKIICRNQGFTCNVRFALKCYLIKSPGTSFLFVFVISVLFLAYIIRIFELPYSIYNEEILGVEHSFHFGNSLWLVLMTIFTVGYGDIVPHTLIGKSLAVICALWGAFLVSLSVLAVTHYFNLTENQERAHEKILHAKEAAKTISLSCKFFVLKKKYFI
jgi:hypothetical protein